MTFDLHGKIRVSRIFDSFFVNVIHISVESVLIKFEEEKKKIAKSMYKLIGCVVVSETRIPMMSFYFYLALYYLACTQN